MVSCVRERHLQSEDTAVEITVVPFAFDVKLVNPLGKLQMLLLEDVFRTEMNPSPQSSTLLKEQRYLVVW